MPGFDILNPETSLKRNYFLEASAGTGKTFAIENCVVRLIQEGFALKSILVVTFTRAAALELKMRIRRNLEEKKMKKVLSEFDEAAIFTIHGFCFHALKENALESGFPLDQIEESSSHTVLKHIFKDFLRTEITPDEIHPKQISKVLGKLPDSLDQFYKSVSAPLHTEGKSYKELIDEIREVIVNLNLSKKELLEDLIEVAPRFEKMCNRQKMLKGDVLEGIQRFTKLFEGNFSDPFNLPVLKMTPDCLLKTKGPYPELLQKLNERLIPLLNQISSKEAILNRLRGRFQNFVTNICDKEDLFFYDALLKKMEESLKKNQFLEKVRGNYQAVLIDEFQDTDALQWKIFSNLFFGHLPIYLVGDPKQAIYRFRGADLYTYMRAKNELGNEAFATLTHNYRSDPTVVQGLNFLFKKAPGLITLPQTGEFITIPEVEPARPLSGEGKITFCEAENESILFSYIVNEIEKLHRLKEIPYKDFAVLVKDRYQAKRFSIKCPLPYVLKRSESLIDSDAFPILEDLLGAVCEPRDRSSVLKVLGGPLFNTPLDKLSSVLEERLEDFYQLHAILMTEGILPFFKVLSEMIKYPSKTIYTDILQLVEILAENSVGVEYYLTYLRQLKKEEKESESLRARIKSEADAVQIMTMHVSKGLEFDTVFPIGLIASADMEEDEDRSEKMRQLYVALTRAKNKLYIPVVKNEKSPLHYFLNRVLEGEDLEKFVSRNPLFNYERCTNESTQISIDPITEQEAEKKTIHFEFSPSAIYSFSSLVQKEGPREAVVFKESEIPPGAETGTLIHKIFEEINFKSSLDQVLNVVAEQLRGGRLENWQTQVAEMIWKTLHFPLVTPTSSFTLADIAEGKLKKEMEFLYPSSEPSGFIKGFVDLFFEHEGKFYIADWKTNYLDSYGPEKVREAVFSNGYDLQAALYTEAAKKYLKLFACEERFEGVFYLFLRGLDSKSQEGIYYVGDKEGVHG